MTRKNVFLGLGALGVLFVTSMIIKREVKIAPIGSLINRYAKNYPDCIDKETGIKRVPLLVYILSKKS